METVKSLESLVFLTECDVERENICFEKRAIMLRFLKAYIESTRPLLLEWREDTRNLWRLSIKYNILNDSAPRGIYPQDLTNHVVCELLMAKRKILHKMKKAIASWRADSVDWQEAYLDFLRSTKVLKWNSPNRFIVGSPHEKPLQFYLDASLDVSLYFHCFHNLVERYFTAMMLADPPAIERFASKLCLSPEIEDVLSNLFLYSRLLMEE